MSDPFTLGLAGVFFGGLLAARGIERLLNGPPVFERPDPGLDRRLHEQLGSLPDGVTVAAHRYSGPDGRGARVVALGACPEIALIQEQGGDVQTGDPRFDATFSCSGPASLVHAVLGESVRRALLDVAEPVLVRKGSLTVKDGRVAIDVPRRRFAVSLADCAQAAEEALVLADMLEAPADVATLLIHNALHDPVSDVRVANLKELARHFRDLPETAATLHAALDNDDAEVRLTAALALGDAGRATLAALAEGGPDGSAAAAIEALGDLPLAFLRRALDHALVHRAGSTEPVRPSVARACVDLLGGKTGSDALELVTQALAARHTAVALAAVHALRRMGTVEVVAPLQEAAASHPDDEVRRAARDAVDDIQTGLIDAAPGQLSLSGGESGAVSLAEDASGRVSLPPAKAPP